MRTIATCQIVICSKEPLPVLRNKLKPYKQKHVLLGLISLHFSLKSINSTQTGHGFFKIHPFSSETAPPQQEISFSKSKPFCFIKEQQTLFLFEAPLQFHLYSTVCLSIKAVLQSPHVFLSGIRAVYYC